MKVVFDNIEPVLDLNKQGQLIPSLNLKTNPDGGDRRQFDTVVYTL